MSGRRLRALVRKEWAEAVRNRAVAGTFVMVAAIFVALPLALAFAPAGELRRSAEADPQVVRLVEQLVTLHPEMAALPLRARIQTLVVQQVIPLFLVLPVLGGMSVATFSIVGEKTSRSLEPLLATPITSGELLLGKTLAAALPAVAGTWIAVATLAAAVVAFGGTAVARLAFDAPALATLGLGAPLVALLGIGIGVLVSGRAQDARGAQQIGALVVLPIVAMVGAKAAGVFLLGMPFVLAGAAVLALIDVVVFAWGARSFDRERVFTVWR